MKHLTTIARYGIYSALGIGAFFGLVYTLGYGHVSELRLFNLIIVLYFTNRLIRENLATSDHIGYLENLGAAFLANLICVVLCLVGLAIFVGLVDFSYFESVNKGTMWSKASSFSEVALVLFLEGMSSAAIISFGLMQYWKNDLRAHKTLYKSSF